MNDRERQQAVLIAQHELGTAQRGLKKTISTVFADHAAKGRLRSGATIKVCIDAIEKAANALFRELNAKLKGLPPDSDAFAVLASAIQQFLDHGLREELPTVLRMATGDGNVDRSRSVAQETQKLFKEMRAEIESKVAIAEFNFEQRVVLPMTTAIPVLPVTAIPPKRGGRPLAEFWDDMWAAIATALYDGTLHPKTQADIERAMAEWITLQGHEAAESTIRARARRLADRLGF